MSEGAVHEQEQHIVPVRVYLMVFGALMFLTWLTVTVASIDLGEPEIFGVRIPLNVVLALLIAGMKASLVVLFFMHVWYSPKLTWLVVGSGLVWLAILLMMTASDYMSRGWLGTPGS